MQPQSGNEGVAREEVAAACCCAAPAEQRIADRFDLRAQRWTDPGAFPAMVDVSARLFGQLGDAERIHPTVLEIGCGTGALSVGLVLAGAARISGIDLSPASIDLARRRAAAAGIGDLARFSVGNAVSDRLEPHDWVILDRSVCCFRLGPRLVDAAIAVAAGRIALSVPESHGWRGLANRLIWSAENLWDRVSGGCPGYVHDLRGIQAQLAAGGFRPVPGRTGHIGLWFVGVFER